MASNKVCCCFLPSNNSWQLRAYGISREAVAEIDSFSDRRAGGILGMIYAQEGSSPHVEARLFGDVNKLIRPLSTRQWVEV
jgi:hypothetical protein